MPAPQPPRTAGRTRRHWAGAVLLFGTCALLAQRALLPVLGSHVYAQNLPGNDSLLHVWTLAWGQHALATDPLHVLDANIFHPHRSTLLYSDHLLGLAVLLSPLRLFTDNAVLVHNLLLLTAPALSALAMYALVRDLTGRASAALVGGFIYGFAPVRLHIDRTQIQMLAAWWLPLILLFARRTLATGRGRDAALAGGTVALQGLSGIYLTAFFVPFLGLAHAGWLVRYPPTRHARGWALLAAAEAVALLVLLPFALAYHGLQASLGTTRSPVLNALLSLGYSAPTETAPLVTLSVLLAAALLARRRLPEAFRREAWLFACLAAGALLLALGPALPLPFGLGSVPGPYAALMSLPGFDALRAPGRMIHVALVGAAALAGGGFAALTGRLRGRAHIAATAAALAVAALECRTPAFATTPAPPPPQIDPVYAWLARQGDDVRIVELPVDAYTEADAVNQYASTGHWKRMLGGTMGIVPPAYPYMVRELRRFPDRDVLASLTALGVTHAVVHGRLLPPAARTALDDRIAAAAPLLERVHAEGASAVYAIRAGPAAPPEPAPGRLLDRTRWRATASHDAARAGLAIDGDARTSWGSWGELERELAARWHDPVPFLARWRRWLAEQPAWLRVDLGAPMALGEVVLRLGGTDPHALPALQVEGSLDGESWWALPGALHPRPDVRALVEQARTPVLGLGLRPPVEARFLRIACAGLEWRLAEIDIHAP